MINNGCIRWFILQMDTREGMAESTTAEIQATLIDTVPTLPPAERAVLLVTIAGLVGEHKQYTKPNTNSKTSVSNGINVYLGQIGDKMTVKGNLVIKYKGAAGEQALRAIMEGKALSGLRQKETEITAEQSLTYDEVKAQLTELGV